ncbi:MAG: ImuA family protein [Caulobacteraceae bacterium]
MSRTERLQAARARIAAIEAGDAPVRGVLPFGDLRIDRLLPGGGLPLGRWHEAAGEGLEIETAVAAAAFFALTASPLVRRGEVVWVMRRRDLYAPGLAGLGFPVERLIQVEAGNEAEALAALEDALASSGVAAALGEVDDIGLVAGRRLQLACEKGGATGFLIRRRPFGGRVRRRQGSSAASTRWKVNSAPSLPAQGEPGLGEPRWRVVLERCRGGGSGAWLMEKSHGAHPLRVVAELGDRELETAQPFRFAS